MSSRKQFLLSASVILALSACGSAMHEDAGSRLEGSDMPAAIAEYKRWTQEEPKASKPFMFLGRAQAKHGDLKDAEESFHTAVINDMKSPEPHQALAEVLIKNGKLDDAKREFDEVAIFDSKSAVPAYGIGMVLAAKGDDKAAVEKFREVIQKDPNHAEAHRELGLSLGKLGDNAGSRAEFDIYNKLIAKQTKK